MKIKLTYILSNIDKAVAFEWISEHINKAKFDISFILFNNKKPYLYNWLKEQSIDVFYINHNGKKSYPKTFIKVFKLIKTIKPNIVHTHLFDANLIGLTVAKILRINKRIYTRHHSTFHHSNFPKAVKYDKISNWLASDIVAISENVKNVLQSMEQVSEKKIHLIHHGFDISRFQNVSDYEVLELKNKYKLDGYPVIGVISRYINLKGIKYTIAAFKNVLTEFPNAVLVLANASGANKDEIKKELETIPKKNYIEIVFEPNLFALYKLFDVYVHVPIDKNIEAFGQTYVESLASKTPSVFTLSGVATEFVVDNYNALIVLYKNSNEIEKAIKQILRDKVLRNKLIKNGVDSVKQFNLNKFISKLEKLYTE